jgi:predicted PurR-regulated permease PerM
LGGNIEKFNYTRYLFIGLFVFLGVISFLILKPFFKAILAGAVLAYIFYPVYKLAKKWIRSEVIASLLVSILIVLLFTLPVIFIANSVSQEARSNYVFIKRILATGDIVEGECDANAPFCKLETSIGNILKDPDIKFPLTNLLTKATNFFVNFAANFIFSIPSFLLNFFVMMFMIYYLFKDGEVLLYRVQTLLPLKEANQVRILAQLKNVTFAVIYGQIFVAALQGFFGGLAFWIFGVSAPVLWGLVMFILALIPFLGTPLVWLPVSITKLANHEPVAAIGIFIIGVIISTADNFIKPKIVGDRAKVHPALIFLGVIGGMIFFGFIGLIVGPVVLSIFMRFIEIYEEERHEAES